MNIIRNLRYRMRSYGLTSEIEENMRNACEHLRSVRLLPVNQRFVVLCVVRNEVRMLPQFLEYYRSIGVEHFLFVDNDSTDGTTRLLEDQADVSLWKTSQNYSDAHYGVDWINWIASNHCTGKWVLTVDADELFVYPDMENRTLSDLLNFLDSQDRSSFFAPPGLFNANHLKRYTRGLLMSRAFRQRASAMFFSPFARRMLRAKLRALAKMPGFIRMRLASSSIETSRT